MDAILGEVRLFAGDYAPRNWMLCDGTLMELAENTALFSILGTDYGGNGATTFALPNLTPTTSASGEPLRYIICVDGVYFRATGSVYWEADVPPDDY